MDITTWAQSPLTKELRSGSTVQSTGTRQAILVTQSLNHASTGGAEVGRFLHFPILQEYRIEENKDAVVEPQRWVLGCVNAEESRFFSVSQHDRRGASTSA